MTRGTFSTVPFATVGALEAAVGRANATHAGFAAQIAALQAAVATLTPGISVLALAEGPTTAVMVGGAADVTLQLSRTMPDTTYQVEPPRLTGATFTVKTRTTTSITFTMQATLAITAGQPLVAAAWR